MLDSLTPLPMPPRSGVIALALWTNHGYVGSDNFTTVTDDA